MEKRKVVVGSILCVRDLGCEVPMLHILAVGPCRELQKVARTPGILATRALPGI